MASFAIRELIIAQSDAKQFDAHTVLGSILLGHKPTEAHSTMVAHLTKGLIRRLIDTDPAAVVGLKGCKNVAEVAARKAELLDTAYECGLYHDVGKSAVILNIDNNGRRLIDEEFQGIQTHPAIGCGLLQEAGCGKYMAPAALYHHRFITAKAAIQGCAAPPAGSQGHRGCAERGGLAGCGHGQHRPLLPDGQAFPHAGGGAESPERHPLRSQSGGPVRRQGFLRRAGAKAGREAQGGLLQAYHIGREKINRKTFHFLCIYDTISSKSAQEERHAQRGKRWKRWAKPIVIWRRRAGCLQELPGRAPEGEQGEAGVFSFPSRSFLLIAMMIYCMVKSLAGGFIPYVAALAGCLVLLGVTQSFPDKHMVLAICADGFLAVCYLLGIDLGCFIYADQPATCFHILAVVLPVLFTRPALWNILRTALYEGVFACCVVTFKTPEVAAMDLMDAGLFRGDGLCDLHLLRPRPDRQRGGAVQAEGHRRDRPEHPDPQPQRLREPHATSTPCAVPTA